MLPIYVYVLRILLQYSILVSRIGADSVYSTSELCRKFKRYCVVVPPSGLMFIRNICAVQQDTQSVLMIEFKHHVCQLDMFRTSPAHLQERFVQAVFGDLVCAVIRVLLDTSSSYVCNGWTCRVVRVYLVGLHMYVGRSSCKVS